MPLPKRSPPSVNVATPVPPLATGRIVVPIFLVKSTVDKNADSELLQKLKSNTDSLILKDTESDNWDTEINGEVEAILLKCICFPVVPILLYIDAPVPVTTAGSSFVISLNRTLLATFVVVSWVYIYIFEDVLNSCTVLDAKVFRFKFAIIFIF